MSHAQVLATFRNALLVPRRIPKLESASRQLFNSIVAVRVSPDGRWAALSRPNDVHLFDLASLSYHGSLPHREVRILPLIPDTAVLSACMAITASCTCNGYLMRCLHCPLLTAEQRSQFCYSLWPCFRHNSDSNDRQQPHSVRYQHPACYRAPRGSG